MILLSECPSWSNSYNTSDFKIISTVGRIYPIFNNSAYDCAMCRQSNKVLKTSEFQYTQHDNYHNPMEVDDIEFPNFVPK